MTGEMRLGPLVKVALFLWVLAQPAHAAPEATLSPRDLASMARIADFEISPDGERVAYTLRNADLASNEVRSSVWTVSISKAGGDAVRVTDDDEDGASPTWSGDGKFLYFLSSRSGSSQVWRLAANGKRPQQITSLPLDVTTFQLSPRLDRIFVTMDIYRHCGDLACTRKRHDAESKSTATGVLRRQLFVRRGDTLVDERRSELFSIDLDAKGIAAADPVEISIEIEGDIPNKPLGSRADYTVSPDGQTVVFSAPTSGAKEAWSTFANLYRVFANGGERFPDGRPMDSALPKNLTGDEDAWNGKPAFSPDGSQVAYLKADRIGADPDRVHLMLLDVKSGASRSIALREDLSILSFAWARDSKSLFATADKGGQRPLWKIDARSGAATAMTAEGSVEAISVGARRVAYLASSLVSPPDIYSLNLADDTSTPVTQINASLLAQRLLGTPMPFSFKGWHDDVVHGYVVKPAAIKSEEKYPVALILHDGPHESLANRWDWLLNAQVFAGAGYGVVLIDFHGSTGYGQVFADSIKNDWGGKSLDDLKAGLEAVEKAEPWIDPRVCAIGAGYGGYLVESIAGQWPGKLKCLVSHAGVFDKRWAAYTADFIWIWEKEFGGHPVFEDSTAYLQQNPIDLVKNWVTPIMFSHGQLDSQVPYEQSLAAFTASQRHGYPGQILSFPDEGHSIVKPANTIQWYDTTIAWLDRWTMWALGKRRPTKP